MCPRVSYISIPSAPRPYRNRVAPLGPTYSAESSRHVPGNFGACSMAVAGFNARFGSWAHRQEIPAINKTNPRMGTIVAFLTSPPRLEGLTFDGVASGT